MAETTKIEWSDATWNPWMGCRKVSPACAHCYAERDMKFYGRNFDVVARAKDATFYAPLRKWKNPKRIFTCSWSDFFIEEADNWRLDAWKVIRATERHTYLILTKRTERLARETSAFWPELFAKNVWIGATVENAKFYQRIRDLASTPAALRFLSLEPLLGRMNDLPLDGISWVIVGGESGPYGVRRPLNLDWVREIRDRCVERGVAFFFKQDSGSRPGTNRSLDGREWNEIPKL